MISYRLSDDLALPGNANLFNMRMEKRVVLLSVGTVVPYKEHCGYSSVDAEAGGILYNVYRMSRQSRSLKRLAV